MKENKKRKKNQVYKEDNFNKKSIRADIQKKDHQKGDHPAEMHPLEFQTNVIDKGTVKIDLIYNANVDEKSILAKATGSENEFLGMRLLEQAIKASFTSKVGCETIPNTVSAALQEIAPNDVLEGMLATQIIAVHNHIMKLTAKACTAKNV
ncbi:MAG: hypothetical protein JSW07_05370, partial [bacterium]